MLNKFKRNIFVIAGALFVLLLFAYITYKTPLAGDDWGYYLNSLKMSPIEGALSFYETWSGRFFSELWGFIVPKNKWLWNIINPLLFTGIFVYLFTLGKMEKNRFIGVLLILAVMLSVDDNLRMETYTWIMGTTYIVPLLFSLVYFRVAGRLFDSETIGKKEKILSILSNILLFVIGLMMENIAACMIGGIVLMLIYAFFKKKDVIFYLAVNLVFSLVSFMIMRMSPGSTFRTVRDAGEWMKLSLFEKLAGQYPNFLELTFIANNYMVLIFSAVLVAFMLFGAKKMKWLYKIPAIFINGVAVFAVFSFVLIKENNFFTSGNNLFTKLFWPVYILMAFVIIFMGIEDEKKKYRTLFYLVIGGAASLVMLYSPTFGSRSVIYTVYYIILVSLLILDEIRLNKVLFPICLLVFGFIITDRTKEYISKYTLVGQAQAERLQILDYYREHPEDEEAWIPRFPIFTVHGGDIEIGDDYHFETFKEYYNLPQSADRIVFYYKESYE